MNENPSIAEPFERELDAGLRRRFAPPARLATLAARASAEAERRAARRAVAGALAWTAAAAVVLGAALFLARSGAPPLPGHAQPAPVSPVSLVVAACTPWTPTASPASAAQGSEVHSPDLVALYRTMDTCQRSAEALACGDDGELEQKLRSTYGQEVELEPGAAALLHGPFSSPEWPTAAILTGAAGNATSVLVADRDQTLACCLLVRLAEDSGLNLFTWKLGELVLTEITPLPEPRLFDCFK